MANKRSGSNGISEQLQSLVREIKGTRTVREFARDTGICTATLSKYMTGNGKGDVKIETLKRIVSEESKPQGSVSFYDLMRAAGLDIKDDFQKGVILNKFEMMDFVDEDGNVIEFVSSPSDREQKMRLAYYEKKMHLELMIKAAIFDRVILSNGQLTLDTSSDKKMSERDGECYDFFLNVKNGTRVRRWYLDFKTQAYRQPDVELIYNEIGRMALKQSFGHEKRSIIVNNKGVFDAIVRHAEPQNSALKADVSIIYYNEKANSLEDEAYLSTYDEDSPMFSIVGL